MATVIIAYNHSRDPMNDNDLANKIAVALALTTLPVVNITNSTPPPGFAANSIIVTHPNVTSANTAAIQTVINAYVLDPTWTGGALSALQAKAVTALTNNATYLAIASPTTAQAITQVAALTRQVDALIRIAANQLDSTSGT